MLRLIIFLILLVASVWVGVEMMRHPGYLLLIYQPWMVQMPIWFAILSVVIGLVLFYLLITSIDRMQFAWFRLRNWLRLRREHQSYSKTQQGLAALIEGHYKKAERLLLAGVNQTVEPLVNYLGAAKAAHEQQAYERRDRYIQKAYQIAPNEEIAIGLTQAELDLDQDHVEQAVATLDRLRQKDGRHPGVLKWLEKVYLRLGDWQNVLALLPYLRKAKVLTDKEIQELEKNVYCQILNNASAKNDEALKKIWQDMPKQMRKDPDVVTAFVKQRLKFPESAKEVEELIRQVLKYHWQAELVSIYGTLPFNQLNRQLIIAGAWMNLYGPRPELLLLLGHLCERLKLWGKAKDYYEKCLNLGPNKEAALAYGKLLETLDEREAALQIYRSALQGGEQGDSPIPLVR